jgi:hypothetical protein
MKINENTIAEIGSDITALLSEHEDELKKAYLKFGDDLTVSLSIKFDSSKEQAVTKMKFVTDKCEDSCTTLLPDRQPSLFQKPFPWSISRCPINSAIVPGEEKCELCDLRQEIIAVPGDRMPFTVNPLDYPDPREDAVKFYQHRSCAVWADEDHHDFITTLTSWVTEEPKTKVYKMKKGKAA